jgi:acetyl esterase/lipase
MDTRLIFLTQNRLLTHPLVSPVLQSSLGNLPPLFIIAGDGEVLRDEITYLAHKAANPAAFPTRPGILRDCRRQKENSEKFTTPTKVHPRTSINPCLQWKLSVPDSSAGFRWNVPRLHCFHVHEKCKT